ncbi:MAG: sulfatase-like hydrolase/transferase, partial [Planctomycetota bacterium]|nr:sulfatase-like hydrolase/transferase [Planctomycetota bacterium]
MEKPKNLIVIHLESISRTNLWQYRNDLGTVWRLMSRSLQFNRFFSSATSTVMAYTDLSYGDSSLFDSCPVFPLTKRYPKNKEAFSELWVECLARGYRVFNFSSSPYHKRVEDAGKFGAAVNNPDIPVLCEKALGRMAAAKREGWRFYAYFWDDSSHLAYPSPIKDRAEGVAGRLRRAYALIDASLNRLLSGLVELGLWDETVVIGFGDHGDEAWSHGLNRGYCHCLVPYASLAWTPMFIFDPGRFPPAITGQLASMVDLKATALGLLFPDQPSQFPRTPFSGLDLFRERREFAFSQNMFALQREYSDPERGMIKGYAATDGDYRLVVSSGGRKPEEGGMELYCDQADPANSLNLLKFFRLDREGGIRRFVQPPEAVASNFTCVFEPPRVESLRAAFNR